MKNFTYYFLVIFTSTWGFSQSSIDLLTPNGGEVLLIGSSYNITWNNTTGINTVFIQYSTDNGNSWTTINSTAPTGATAGSYLWNPIPPTPSANALVRVLDALNPTVGDTSDAVFSISNGTAALTSPNGGETWYIGSTQNITWSYTGSPSQYDIEYSTDNGTTWNIIANNVSVGSVGGGFIWVVPNTPSNQCLVKITDVFDPFRQDISDTVFTITQYIPRSITIVEPNGGEVYTPGTSANISWTYTGAINQVILAYTTDNGFNWTTLDTVPANSSPYSWIIPNTPSHICVARIKDLDSSSVFDMSNSFFQIQSLGMGSLNDFSIKLFPNPVTDLLVIQHNLSTSEFAEIYSIDGKLIYETELVQQFTNISTKNFKPGIYLVRIKNKVFKIIKN